MAEPLSFGALSAILREAFRQLPDARSGPQKRYTMTDAALAAFSVFFMQCPSFLAHQRDMQRRKGTNNAQTLFGVTEIPSDPQIRNLLDPVDPAHLRAPFWAMLERAMADEGVARTFRVGGRWLVALDGTEHFHSTAIHCPHCTVSHPGEAVHYAHTVLLPVLVQPDQRLPSTASITRWLRQEGLTRRYERHQPLPNTGPPPGVTACHEEWEMDARGYETIPGVGVVALIDINDVGSRVKIASYPCWLGAERASRHPTTEDYQLVLRLAFSAWGLPDRLAVDHDSVFYDNKSKSPFPTRLHLWLIALGVDLTFGRFGRPTDQAITERSHQTWDRQALQGQTFVSHEALVQALTQRRHFLNTHLPCASLDGQPPLVAHPEARLPRRRYRPEWEAENLDMGTVYAYLAQGRWFRKASNIGAVSLGGTVYYLAHAWRRAEVIITFDPEDQHLVFRTAGQEDKRLPMHNLSSQALVGELGACHNLAHFQLALPLTWQAWRASFSSCLACGMTL
jgi:transposase InsO family protein